MSVVSESREDMGEASLGDDENWAFVVGMLTMIGWAGGSSRAPDTKIGWAGGSSRAPNTSICPLGCTISYGPEGGGEQEQERSIGMVGGIEAEQEDDEQVCEGVE